MKNAIIALDYTEMDEFVIKNSRSFMDKCNITDLTFIHVVPNYLNVNNLSITSVNLGEEPIDQLVSKLIMKKVESVYGKENQKYNIRCQILEGSPYTQLINYMKVNPTDLFVTGKKHKSKGSGITSRRIAHHIATNVLFITEEVSPEINKIGVPIDFSANSARALKHAISIAPPTAMIQPVHVISHTPTDHYLGLNYNSTYRGMYLSAAENEYNKLLSKYKIDTSKLIDIRYLEDEQNNVSKNLREYFDAEKTDLIVMGARGHNALDVILYGSVAEKFVDYNDAFPTMVIR